jgi:RNA polymerase sigma factor (sigma-70 family)
MQSRQTLIEIFSTFLNLSADRGTGWQVDGRLQRHMQIHLAQNEAAKEDFWALYWLRHWQVHWQAQNASIKLAEGHLSAYLQETCYWSVQRVVPRVGGGQFTLADCFQVAIIQLPKVLKKFDADRPNLKAYAYRAFGNFVRDYLRQRQEVDFCTDWGLLLKVSRKRLLEALQQGGINRQACDRILLAWTCFEATSLPTKVSGLRQIAVPDASTWEAIMAAYDRQRSSLQPPAPSITQAQMERELLQASKQLRAMLYPSLKSLNQPKFNDVGDTGGELQDDLPASAQDSLLIGLIHQEEITARQQQQMQMRVFLETTIVGLGTPAQDLLRYYYADGLKQQQIAQQLGIQQYTVSRQLTKIRESLLLKFVQWSQATWHISPDSNVVESISTLLDDWLYHHHQKSPQESPQEL